MQRKAFGILAGTIAVTALLIGTIASAADQPAAPQGHGMIERQPGGMMGHGMTGMMGGASAAMTRMIENCNRMMENRLQDKPPSPGSAVPDKNG